MIEFDFLEILSIQYIVLLRGDSLTRGGGGLKNLWGGGGSTKFYYQFLGGIIEFRVSTIGGITKLNLIGNSKINIW